MIKEFIKELFDYYEVSYEEIPQNYYFSLWARKLKTATYFSWFSNYEDGLWEDGEFIFFIICVCSTTTNIPPVYVAGWIGVIISSIFLAKSFIKWIKKTNAKYENRRYFRVSKDEAKCIDELAASKVWKRCVKYSAKFSEIADDEPYILIVLEGESEDDSSFLLFPQSAINYAELSTYFSAKKCWFKTPRKSKDEIIQEQQEKIQELEDMISNQKSGIDISEELQDDVKGKADEEEIQASY